ncbi:MAG: hypothetical protein QXN21_03860 [Candidatus Bathyarchaeia archaeon]
MKVSASALFRIFGAAVTVVLSFIMLYRVFVDGAALWSYGLLGVFLAALLSHLSIIARGVFLPALLSLTEFYNPAVLGLVAGLGGAFGEVTVYFLGSGIRNTLDDRREDDPLSKLAEKYWLILMILFAASPLPDTPIVLLAGSFRLPLWKVILIQATGKTTLYVAGAYVGGLVFMELKSTLEYETASIILLAASLILSIIVSWRKSRDKILKVLGKIYHVLLKDSCGK